VSVCLCLCVCVCVCLCVCVCVCVCLCERERERERKQRFLKASRFHKLNTPVSVFSFCWKIKEKKIYPVVFALSYLTRGKEMSFDLIKKNYFCLFNFCSIRLSKFILKGITILAEPAWLVILYEPVICLIFVINLPSSAISKLQLKRRKLRKFWLEKRDPFLLFQFFILFFIACRISNISIREKNTHRKK